MKEIWTKDEAEFHGEFVNFDKMLGASEARSEAAPADPHGRRRPHHLRPRLEFGDGWMPIVSRMETAFLKK